MEIRLARHEIDRAKEECGMTMMTTPMREKVVMVQRHLRAAIEVTCHESRLNIMVAKLEVLGIETKFDERQGGAEFDDAEAAGRESAKWNEQEEEGEFNDAVSWKDGEGQIHSGDQVDQID